MVAFYVAHVVYSSCEYLTGKASLGETGNPASKSLYCPLGHIGFILGSGGKQIDVAEMVVGVL